MAFQIEKNLSKNPSPLSTHLVTSGNNQLLHARMMSLSSVFSGDRPDDDKYVVDHSSQVLFMNKVHIFQKLGLNWLQIYQSPGERPQRTEGLPFQPHDSVILPITIER